MIVDDLDDSDNEEVEAGIRMIDVEAFGGTVADEEDDGADEEESLVARREKILLDFVCNGGDPSYVGENSLDTPTEFFDWWKANQAKSWPKVSTSNVFFCRKFKLLSQTIDWMKGYGFAMSLKQIKGV